MIIVIMKTIIKSSKTIIIIIVYNVTVMGLNMNGPLDHWTIFLDYFLDHFLDNFLDLFFYPIFFLDHFMIGGGGGNTPLVLREWWDAVNQFLGSGERQTVITSGGVEDELLVRREGWEAVIEINATD